MECCVDCDGSPVGAEGRCADCLVEIRETPEWLTALPASPGAGSKMRIALCGHEYTVPHEVRAGRRRKLCDMCLAQDRSVTPGRRELTLRARAKVAATARWRRENPMAPRKAACGHHVPYHPGLQRRRCDACASGPPRSCARCGASIDQKPRSAKYCSPRCGEIARGQRLAEPLSKRSCALPDCGLEFQPKSPRQRCCCERHGKILCNREGRASGRYAPDPWSDRRRDNYHRRRALKKGASTGRPVKLAEIAERDRWRCGICRKAVSKRLQWPHPRSASLDHIVPLTEDGSLHDPVNVRLAHLVCNTIRGNRGGGEQLLLVG